MKPAPNPPLAICILAYKYVWHLQAIETKHLNFPKFPKIQASTVKLLCFETHSGVIPLFSRPLSSHSTGRPQARFTRCNLSMFVLKYLELAHFLLVAPAGQGKRLLFCHVNLMAYSMKPFVAYSSNPLRNPIILSQWMLSLAERINLVGWLRECEKIRINYVT